MGGLRLRSTDEATTKAIGAALAGPAVGRLGVGGTLAAAGAVDAELFSPAPRPPCTRSPT